MLAFLQADLEVPVYMELPAVINLIDISDKNRRRSVLKLNKSLYGLKQAGYNWFENFMKDWLLATSFKVRLTSAFSFKKIALFSLMSMIALSLERQWRILIWLFHHYKQATKIFIRLIKVVSTNVLGC